MRVVWNLEDWASAVVDLPSATVFAQRTWAQPSIVPGMAAQRTWNPPSIGAGAPWQRTSRPPSADSLVTVVGSWAPSAGATGAAPRAAKPSVGAAGCAPRTVGSPLPRRTVLVPNARIAHALRCALVARGASGALMGTSFVSARELAARLVRDAGEAFEARELELGASLAREALERVELAHFDRAALLALPGWDEAFAHTLRELESAQVPLGALLASAEARVRDIGRVFEEWQTLEHPEGDNALFARAIRLLEQGRAWEGATLAVATGFESVLEARFVGALPEVTRALWAVRPLAPEIVARVAALYGEASARALVDARAGDGGAGVSAGVCSAASQSAGVNESAAVTESAAAGVSAGASASGTALARLRDELCGGGGRGAGCEDESLTVAFYPGVHEEVEAAVGWVVEQVVERGLALHEIALLSPEPERYASPLCARLAALPWLVEARAGAGERNDVEARANAGERNDVHVRDVTWREGGMPVVERSDGARLLLVVRVLREGLAREALAPLLPALRGRAQVTPVRGLSRARELLRAVATAGGTRTQLAGGRAWPEAWEHAVLELELASGEDPAARRAQRELQLALAGLAPAIDGLTDVLRSVLAGEPLSLLWTRLSAFGQVCLRVPQAEPPVWTLVEDAVADFEGREEVEPTGVEALDWLEHTLRALRVPPPPYGGPRVYIGSLASARALSFRAVRVLGLVERALPGLREEDSLLPDAARTALSPLLFNSRLHAQRELSAFADALRTARERVALSAPRVRDGHSAVPASVLFAAARALCDAGAGGLVRQLEAVAERGQERERAARARLPVGASARLECAAQRKQRRARERERADAGGRKGEEAARSAPSPADAPTGTAARRGDADRALDAPRALDAKAAPARKDRPTRIAARASRRALELRRGGEP